ncbi:hypothetical protein [Pseudomonas ovata]|uniref:hypothetical protein n=1 Tax=Pseudomonas ovata TaxID=1839709 RepID=UPI00126039DF|nr:hypothetical protein [Pseudomonas ovata]
MQCYKAGAYRSSVVACWIAVAFDLVDKIRELAALGDKQAIEQINRFNRIHENNDIPGALNFEKELPDMALNKFSFISHSEFRDLERLVEDRNRCAHPSQVSESQIFVASAELARLHISNSIRSVLSQRATQGKASLARLMEELESRYFPSKQDDVYKFLGAGPLSRPTVALYRNYLQVLVIALTRKGVTVNRQRASHALTALKMMHPDLWQEQFPSVVIKQLTSVTSDEDLSVACDFLIFPLEVEAWKYLSDILKLKFTSYVFNISKDEIHILQYMLELTQDHPLHKAAAARINSARLEELRSVVWTFSVPQEAFKRLVYLYSLSTNIAAANSIGKVVRSQIELLLNPDVFVDELVICAKSNDKVLLSDEFPYVLKELAHELSAGRNKVLESVERLGLEIDVATWIN